MSRERREVCPETSQDVDACPHCRIDFDAMGEFVEANPIGGHLRPARPTPEVAPDVPDERSARDVAHMLMDRFKFGDTKCPSGSRAQLHSIACEDITGLLEAWRARRSPGGGR
jgi:hypothetical protein